MGMIVVFVVLLVILGLALNSDDEKNFSDGADSTGTPYSGGRFHCNMIDIGHKWEYRGSDLECQTCGMLAGQRSTRDHL